MSEIVWIPDSIRNERWEAAIREGYEFRDEYGNVIDSKKIVVVKKEKEYPKTYEECCDVLNYNPDFYDATKFLIYGYMSDELRSFQKLLVCRDAYWKIAGDEMGLGKPWKQKLDNNEKIYFILNMGKVYECEGREIENRIFAFPTEEMRDAFKENFDTYLDVCKEFL